MPIKRIKVFTMSKMNSSWFMGIVKVKSSIKHLLIPRYTPAQPVLEMNKKLNISSSSVNSSAWAADHNLFVIDQWNVYTNGQIIFLTNCKICHLRKQQQPHFKIFYDEWNRWKRQGHNNMMLYSSDNDVFMFMTLKICWGVRYKESYLIYSSIDHVSYQPSLDNLLWLVWKMKITATFHWDDKPGCNGSWQKMCVEGVAVNFCEHQLPLLLLVTSVHD